MQPDEEVTYEDLKKLSDKIEQIRPKTSFVVVFYPEKKSEEE